MSGFYFPEKTELVFFFACGHQFKQFVGNGSTALEVQAIREEFLKTKCVSCLDGAKRYQAAKEKREREIIRAHFNLFTGVF